MELLILLLSMFVMIKEEKPIDYPVIENVQLQLSTDPGIATPKQDARVQVNNIVRYLDWVKANASQIIPTPMWSWEWTLVSWYTYTVIWKLDFKSWTNGINIPLSWTYLINIRVIIDDLFWDMWLTKLEVLKNWSYLLSEWKLYLTYYESITISSVENLQKWDIIQVQLNADEEMADRTLNVSVSVTKLS